MIELLDAESTPLLELDHVSRSYQQGGVERWVLDDVSLAIQPGEIVALYGRSGSGKSTLLNVSGGLDTPTRGTVTLAGQDLSGLSERARTAQRRTACSYIFQEYNLIRTLTALENVRLPLEFDQQDSAKAQADALAALRAVEMEQYADRFPDQLSGGEQQRVAIARALAGTTGRLLLVDEPTGALDRTTGAAVLGLLRQCRSQLGACLIATHDASVAEIADRVLELRDGRLLGDPVLPAGSGG